jgi:hypothetical protein
MGMSIDAKDPKRTAKFRTERRKGLYMDLPPARPRPRWPLVVGVAAAVAIPTLLILLLVKILMR